MSELIASACAPSNIALIKYMGKKDRALNLPENGSISLTLHKLCSLVEIYKTDGDSGIRWVPELPSVIDPFSGTGLPAHVPTLSEAGIARLIRHVERVRVAMLELLPRYGLSSKKEFGEWELRTANTFPASSGIASSASSFAAATLAAALASVSDRFSFEQQWMVNQDFKREFSRLARLGSGSSCRSFEGAWVEWRDEKASSLNTHMPKMANFVLVVSEDAKKVASSDAHSLVTTSPLWQGRVQRVEQRLQQLSQALSSGDIPTVARIAWDEAWEMHSLFHTSADPFTYWEPGTMDVLKKLSPLVKEPFPPIVTLDAGPNVHVIVEAASADGWRDRLKTLFPNVKILEDTQGPGAFPVGGLL